MDNISKIILDDSEYLPRLQKIGDEWKAAADAEENAMDVSAAVIAERIEGLDALDKKFIRNIGTLKKAKAAEDAHTVAQKTSAVSTGIIGKSMDKVTATLSKWVTKLKGAKKSEEEIQAVKKKNKAIYDQSIAGLKAEIAQTSILGTNLGQLNTTTKAAIAVGKAWVGMLGVTKVALIATGIGAFVVVLGSLITYLKNTVEGQDFLNRKLAAAGAVFSSVKDVVIGFGKAVFDAVSNPLKAIKSFGAGVYEFLVNPAQKAIDIWNSLKGQVSGIVEDIKQDASAAESIEGMQQKLRDNERALRVEFAKTRAEIELRKKGSDDVNKSVAERKRLAEEAFTMENALLNKQIKLAEDSVNLIKQKNSLSTSGIEDLDVLADAEIALQDIRQGSFTIQTELQNKINGLNKEAHAEFLRAQAIQDAAVVESIEKRRAELEALKGDYAAIASSLMASVFEIDLQQASPVEAVKMREEKALEEIAKTRASFMDTSKKALLEGLITQSDVDAQIANLDAIESAVKDRFEREAAVIELPVKAIPDLDIKALKVPEKGIKDIAEATGGAFSKPLQKSFKEGVQDALDGAVGFFEENADQFEAFKGFFNNITDIFTSGIDSQISKIDELIAKNDEKIAEIEDQISKEADADEVGLANRLDALNQELEAEKVKREESIEQKQALEKKAAKAQLVNDVLQQSSSLITASANIFKAMSGIPFVGVPLAIGFIAAMFGAFAKSKIDAAKASKLYKGTGRIDEHFKTYAGHKSDLYGNGYAITDADTGQDTGVRISGKEPLINEKVGQGVNRPFFEELNANPERWRNFDIARAVAVGRAGIQKVKQTAVFAAKSAGAEAKTSTQAVNRTNQTKPTTAEPKTVIVPKKEASFTQYLSGAPTHKVVIEGGIRRVEELN